MGRPATHQWRGRDRGVPRPAAGRRRDPGDHAAARAARRWCPRRQLSELTGCDVHLKVEGAEPDRVVQGPRHDAWRSPRRPRQRRPGRDLRLDRQHRPRRPRRTPSRGRHALRRAGARGQDRDGQAEPGDRARRHAAAGRGQLRRLPDPGPRARRGTTRSRWSTRSTRPASRARRRRRSRSSTPSATPPTCTACRSATPATSRPTGRATASTPQRRAPATPDPADVGLPGRRRRADRRRRTRSPSPRPSPPPSGSATRPRGDQAVAARDESGGLIDAVTDERSWRAHRLLAAREGVFVEPASAAGVAGLLAGTRTGGLERGPDRRLHRHRARAQGPAVGPRTGDGPAPRRPVRRAGRRRRRGCGARPGRLTPCPPGARRSAGRRPRPRAGPGHQRQPRSRLRLPSASPSTVYDDLDVAGHCDAGARASTVDGRGQRTPSRATRRTWSSGRCARASAARRPRPGAWRCACAQPDPARARPRLVRGRDRRGAGRRPRAGRRRATSGCDDARLLALATGSRAIPTTSAAALLGGFDHGVDRRRAAPRAVGCGPHPRPASPPSLVPTAGRSTARRPAGCCRRPSRTPTPR